jgi:hypothetical protein
VVDYTPAIDAQIAEILRNRGRVEPWNLAGIDDEDGVALLRQYARVHESEGGLSFEGATLSVAPTDVQGVSASAPALSPVDQVLQAPVGASRLDTKPAGARVPTWWWLLPFTFLALGGVIAWWFVRDENRAVARAMLITGIVMTVLTVATIGPTTSLINEMTSAMRGL